MVWKRENGSGNIATEKSKRWNVAFMDQDVRLARMRGMCDGIEAMLQTA